MSNIQIPNLPAVAALSGAELFEGVQAGSSVKISLGQILVAAAIGTPTSLPLPVAVGGTGATTASGARTNLGLGTIAIQDANSVVLTGGSINGTTIGGTTPAAGTFSTATINGGNINATIIGGTTPAAGSFSTGTFGLGAVGAPSITFSGDANTGIWSPAAETVAISTNGAERMRIDATGDVGIGATSISAVFGRTLQVGDGSTAASISLPGTGAGTTGDVFLTSSTSTASLIARASTSLLFGTNDGEKMRIDVAGNVGIGTNNPIANLQVNAAATASSLRLSVADVTYANFFASASGSGVSLYNIQSGPLIFGANNTEYLRIGSTGAIGIAGANYGTSGQTIISGGAGAAPAWGTLGLAGGGTGVTTAPAAAAVLYGYTTTATAAGTTVLTNTSSQYQLFTGVTTQTITLPVTSTLTTGWTFHIVNNSTGNLTVNSSGASLVATVPANMTLMVTCIGTTLTTAADWEWGFTDFGSVTGTGSVVLGTGPTITNGALNGTVGATTPSTGAFTTVTASTSILSPGAGGIGYSTGAGVAVTQLTSRTTPAPTTGNKMSGSITLFSAAGVAGWTTFTVPNTAIAITDTVVLTVRGNTNTYVAAASTIIAGTSFAISFNAVAGVAVDAPTINFNIIRGVSA